MRKSTFLVFVFCLLAVVPEIVFSQTLRAAFGTNSRQDDPVDQQNFYPRIREYHEWIGDQGLDSDNVPNWPANAFTFARSDDYYRRVSGEIIQTAFGLPGEMRGISIYDTQVWLVQKPFIPLAGPGSVAPFSLGNTKTMSSAVNGSTYFGDWLALQAPNQADPQHWLLKAHWMTVMADRFGVTNLPSSERDKLHRASTNASTPYVTHATTASGRVKWFETENEPDRSWLDPAQDLGTARTMWQTSPSMLAAQTSMVYDGHGRSSLSLWPYGANTSNGVKLGVNSVNPTNKVAIAGMAGLRGAYIEEMIQWFATNRITNAYGYSSGVKLPFDAISLHHYATNDYRALQEGGFRTPIQDMEQEYAGIT